MERIAPERHDDVGREGSGPARTASALPPVGEPGEHRRPASALRYAGMLSIIGQLVVTAIAIGVLLFVRTELAAWIVLAGVLPLAALWLTLELTTLNRWDQRHYTYTVSDDFVYITSGRFFRMTKTLPTPHILSVETQQGPLERSLGLMTVRFATIAGQDDLGPIAAADAERIRDRVTQVLVEQRDA